jgi:putative membrane protein
MKVLVLCIDRDDDLGQKTGIEGPVIGRGENVRAALALGLADPEDADTNTILAAISTYDDLAKRDITVDIATITGDVNVGYQSDIMLTKQLEEALEVTGATSVILVSNGAEDEYIFPMISSRTRVDSVRTVMVKQSKSVESTWYYFVKQIKDARTRRKIIAPAGLILFAIGMLVLIPVWSALYNAQWTDALDELSGHVFGVLSLVAGLILLQNAFRFRATFRGGVKRARRSLYSGDVSIPLFILAVIVFIIGLIKGYDAATSPNLQFDDALTRSLLFLDGSFYWLTGALLVNKSKNLVNALIRREPVPRGFWLIAMALVAITFLVLGGVHYMLFALDVPIDTTELAMYTEIGIGIGIAIFGAILQRRITTEVQAAREGWRR